MDTISEAHQQSMMSELRANISTRNPGNTLEQSATMQQTTKESLANSQKDFDRKHERNLKKLDKLSTDVDQLDLLPLSEQVHTQKEFNFLFVSFTQKNSSHWVFSARGNVFFFNFSKKLTVSLHHLTSHLFALLLQICGGAVESEDCSGSPCGGLGCEGKDGEAAQCGGGDCKGLTTTSQNALKSAKDIDQQIVAAMQEVDKLSRMVSPYHGDIKG